MRTTDNRDHTMVFTTCVNCAGASAGHVAKLAGIGTDENPYLTVPLPVEPRYVGAGWRVLDSLTKAAILSVSLLQN